MKDLSRSHAQVILGLIGLSLLGSCRRARPPEPEVPSTSEPVGFSLLRYLPGIYQGPVVSTTSVGNFPFWGIDFRPMHAGQVGGRSELDSANTIHLNFFVADYQGRSVLCFRNGGYFQGIERISYLMADSAVEGRYYRFVEPITQGRRAYAEVIFPSGDSLILASYTNKMGTRPSPVLHMRWRARRTDSTAHRAATAHFSYPKAASVRSLTGGLEGRTEAIWYSPIQNDPYPERDQPYTGTLQASYQHGSYVVDAAANVYLFLTTQALIEGYAYYAERLGTLSRYVRLKAAQTSFTFQHVHPGRYYLYALYDQDGNGQPSSGDWFNVPGAVVDVPSQGSASALVPITFRLP